MAIIHPVICQDGNMREYHTIEELRVRSKARVVIVDLATYPSEATKNTERRWGFFPHKFELTADELGFAPGDVFEPTYRQVYTALMNRPELVGSTEG